MLVTAISGTGVAAGSTESGTVACKTLNGVWIKDNNNSLHTPCQYNITANGNTLLNNMDHSGAVALTKLYGALNNYQVVYIPFGAVKVNGAVEIQVKNNDASATITYDVLVDVDRPGKIALQYAKYTGNTFTAQNVSCAFIHSTDGTSGANGDNTKVTMRAGNATQTVTINEAFMYGATQGYGSLGPGTEFGLLYKGRPISFNLTSGSIEDDQFWITQSAWRS